MVCIPNTSCNTCVRLLVSIGLKWLKRDFAICMSCNPFRT
jgi:hypothetical protein